MAWRTHVTLIPECAPGYVLQACKPVMGKYYREPQKSPGPIPVHLLKPLARSFKQDHYVDDTGDIVFYKQDPGML